MVGDDGYLTGSRWHVNGHSVEGRQLLGGHDVLISGAKYLVDLGNALCTKCEGCYRLRTADLVDIRYTAERGRVEYRGVDLAIARGGRA